MRTIVIAEAGVNHNGDVNQARQLVQVAAQAGADIVKFQTFSADALVTVDAVKADYQMGRTPPDETQHEMLKHLELSPDAHHLLIEECSLAGIEFLSTAFDIDSVSMLAGFGLARFKVPSGEITNLPYLRHIGALGKPVLLSTGMATLGEIESAINVLVGSGTPRDQLTVLHCNTEYPTPMKDANLRAMLAIRDAFQVAVGYSDHTLGIEAAIAATALGASVIEKHFTLDRSLPGPDHQASLEPSELAALVSAVRNIELALGDGLKRPSDSEAKNKPISRKSIVATRDIAQGEYLSEANLTTKRPGLGLSPMRWDEVIGTRARRPFSRDERIEL